jgi:hypothetical protein
MVEETGTNWLVLLEVEELDVLLEPEGAVALTD